MKPFIKFLYTTRSGKTDAVTLKKKEFTIGRSHECDLVLPYSEVSRRHCKVSILPGGVSFTDIRPSSVGLLHNGKYKKAGLINPGDEFFIGDTRFVMIEFSQGSHNSEGSTYAISDAVFEPAPPVHDSSMVREISNVIRSLGESRNADSADKILLDDETDPAPSRLPSAVQTAIGASVVSGRSENDMGGPADWSDITALSIAAKNRAPVRRAEPKRDTRLVAALGVCVGVAVIAVIVAICAVNARPATPPAAAAGDPAPIYVAVKPNGDRVAISRERAGLLDHMNELKGKRAALVQSNNEYIAQADQEAKAFAAKITDLEARISECRASGALEAMQAAEVERARVVASQMAHGNATKDYVEDNFSIPLKALDEEIKRTQAKLDAEK